MIQSGYTQLFGSIVASTIWREDDKTRIVWITLLALSDWDGYVAASTPGLADLARVSVAECEQALEKLQQPDKYSRSPEHGGRRIQPVDGGWLVLNRAKYRAGGWEQRRLERHREANRRYYQRKKTQNSDTNSDNSDNSDIQSDASDSFGDKTYTETKTYTEKRTKNTCSPNGEASVRIYKIYPRQVGKAAALKAIRKALGTIQREKHSTLQDAIDFLYLQVTKFSQSPAGQRGQYTPHPATWFNSGRYFDDPVEWHTTTTPSKAQERAEHNKRAILDGLTRGTGQTDIPDCLELKDRD